MQRWEDPPIFSCRPESPQCRRGRYLWSRFRDRPRCLPGLLVLPAVQVRDAHLLPRSQTGAHAPSDAGQLPPAVMLMTGFPMVFKISTPPIRKRDTCGMIISSGVVAVIRVSTSAIFSLSSSLSFSSEPSSHFGFRGLPQLHRQGGRRPQAYVTAPSTPIPLMLLVSVFPDIRIYLVDVANSIVVRRTPRRDA